MLGCRTQPGLGGGGCHACPPPPPPGVQARLDQLEKARNVADLIPDEALFRCFGGGVSSDPDLPTSWTRYWPKPTVAAHGALQKLREYGAGS
ncbi:hypothetical protein GCM10027258_54810 [Amycolatopsis stemonae]